MTTNITLGGVGFISTILLPEVPLPLELLPGLTLRKASDDEYHSITSELRRYGRQGTFLDAAHYFESEYIWQEDGKGASNVDLPKDKWRYFVVEFEDDGTALLTASRAFILADSDLVVPMVIHRPSIATIMNRISLIGDLSAIFGHPYLEPRAPRSFKQSDVDVIQQIHSELQSIPSEFEGIHRAIDMLLELRTLKENSPFRILGYFAILELLLTHNPGGKELGDSLTHQISTKIPLISKRLSAALPYFEHFGENKESNIWKKYYNYRSALAHGSQISFKDHLALLRSPANALNFLSIATRAIARHALREPELFMDLKAI